MVEPPYHSVGLVIRFRITKGEVFSIFLAGQSIHGVT